MSVNVEQRVTTPQQRRVWPAIALVAVGFLFGVASVVGWRWVSDDPALLVEDERLRLEDPLDSTRRAYAQWIVYERRTGLLGDERPDLEDHDTLRRTLLAYLKSPFVLTAALRDSSASGAELLREEEDPVGWLARRLVAYYPADGEVLTLALPHASAAEGELVAIVNAVAKAFQDEVLFRQQSDQRLPLQLLKRQLGKTQRAIADTQDRYPEPTEDPSAVSAESAAQRRKLDVLIEFERELQLRVEELQLEALRPDRVSPLTPGQDGAARATFDSGEETLPWLE